MGAAAKAVAPLAPCTARPLAAVLVERLVAAGTWVNRATLVRGLSTSAVALEDALADLVVDAKAEWRDGAGYRLAGGLLARQAAQKRQAGGHARQVLGREINGAYRVGVAELVPGVGPVMYELVLPLPGAGPQFMAQHQKQVQAVMDFSMRGSE
ncbi:hypothetical protein [Rhodoferax sp. WC2427]|uniref:hypothetical protein n=1 Tax=Rhodoferax sp. WC2427 TaxID=3234144 RepID=UPI003467D184